MVLEQHVVLALPWVRLAAAATLLLGGAGTATAQSSPADATPAASVSGVPPVAPEPDRVPPATTAADRLDVTLGGLVQIDWRVHGQASLDEIDPSTGAPLNEDRILLRRGRLFARAKQGPLSGRIELDANSVAGFSVRPFDASVSVRWPANASDQSFGAGVAGDAAREEERESLVGVLATAGLMRIPFGVETSEPSALRPLLERSTWSGACFGAGRDFGAGVDAVYQFLEGSLALMNGEPLDTGRYAGLDLNRSKDLVARLGVASKLGDNVRVDAGFSGLSGTGLHLGTPGTKETLAWSDSNENGLVDVSELSVIPGTPATPAQRFSRSALGGDLRVRVKLPVLGALTARGELVRAQNLDRALVPADPVAVGRPLRERGFALGVSQELTRHALLSLRYDSYNPDADARRAQGGLVVPSDASFSTLAVAAAARSDHARLLLEYDHNWNALGRAASGAPDRLRNDLLTFRAEMRF